MHVPRRTGTLLVFAGSIGLATSFFVCMCLHQVLAAVRDWHCTYESCTVPAAWTVDRTRDVLLLTLGVLRSVLQLRAGSCMQQAGFDRRGPLVAYLGVAALDTALLCYLGELPTWTLVLAGAWPLFVFAITRSSSVRPLVWEPMLPAARLL